MSVAFNIYLPNTARYNVIRIDRFSDGDIQGQFYNCAIQKCQPFKGMMDLIRQLDHFFDKLSFPMDQVSKRTFFDEVNMQEKKVSYEFSAKRDIDIHQGQFATFILRVQSRSSASWQGEVSWLEKNRKQYFRSVLELMLLIEEAMSLVEIKKDG